jgi:hypothetical protein
MPLFFHPTLGTGPRLPSQPGARPLHPALFPLAENSWGIKYPISDMVPPLLGAICTGPLIPPQWPQTGRILPPVATPGGFLVLGK